MAKQTKYVHGTWDGKIFPVIVEDHKKNLRRSQIKDMNTLLNLASTGYSKNATTELKEKYLSIKAQIAEEILQENLSVRIPYFLTKEFPGYEALDKTNYNTRLPSSNNNHNLESELITDESLRTAYQNYHSSLN